ncbi:MAG: hypothetical protein AAGE76_08920 [Pseudomonadota bacterium]
MIRRWAAVAVLAASAAMPLAAQQGGDSKCGPRDQMTERLGVKFGEQLHSGGLTGPTKLLEIWTSEDSGSWTILLTDADGTSCIVAAGNDWVDFPAAMMGQMGVDS